MTPLTSVNCQYKFYGKLHKSLLTQLDAESNILVRRGTLQNIKSDWAAKKFGAQVIDDKAARLLGIGDDPALIDGTTKFNNKMLKYVSARLTVTYYPQF